MTRLFLQVVLSWAIGEMQDAFRARDFWWPPKPGTFVTEYMRKRMWAGWNRENARAARMLPIIESLRTNR